MKRLPPLLERSPLDDLKVLGAVLLGAGIGWLIFEPGDGVIWAYVITAAVLFVVLNLIRLWLRAVQPRGD